MKAIVKTSLLVLLILLFTAAASAATFVVNTTADTQDANAGDGVCADSGGLCSFRAALTESNALSGEDVINLPAGIFTQSLAAANEDANAGGDWDINSPGTENNGLTINGAGIDSTILQSAATPNTASQRVLDILTNGFPALGGAVRVKSLTIRNGVQIGTEDPSASLGGGIRNLGAMYLTDVKVMNNKARGAGGIRNENFASLTNVNVTLNSCVTTFFACNGGGMYNALGGNSGVLIKDSSFTDNSAVSTDEFGFAAGGGIGIETNGSSFIHIENTVIADNFATVNNQQGGILGAGLFISSGGGHMQLEIYTSTASGNFYTGGAYHIGAGMYIGTVTGGSITAELDRISSKQNAGSFGAGMSFFARGGTMDIGVFNSSVSGNSALNGGGVGIFNDSTDSASHININMLNSTVSGNGSAVNGGGIYVDHTSSGTAALTASFCTITNNSASFSSNGTTGGGGIYNGAGSIVLKNSVVSGNFTGQGSLSPDILGAINSLDYDHIGITNGAVITGTTTHNTTGNAQLGALANNGGPTLSHMPQPGSIVIDSIPNGVNDCGTLIPSDQRLFSRPAGVGCDKGAVELSGPWSLSGTIKTTNGQPIRNAAVTISGGSLPAPITVFTGNLGTYQFTNLAGSEYEVSVSIKRYHFNTASQNFSLGSNITDADFIANAPFSREVLDLGQAKGKFIK